MATAQVMTRGERWEARALALAWDRHLIGTPRYVGKTDSGAHLWRVPSRTHDGCYLVTAWPRGSYTCCCTAGSYGRPCGHAGAVVRAELQRQAAMAQADTDAMKSWRRGFDW